MVAPKQEPANRAAFLAALFSSDLFKPFKKLLEYGQWPLQLKNPPRKDPGALMMVTPDQYRNANCCLNGLQLSQYDIVVSKGKGLEHSINQMFKSAFKTYKRRPRLKQTNLRPRISVELPEAHPSTTSEVAI